MPTLSARVLRAGLHPFFVSLVWTRWFWVEVTDCKCKLECHCTFIYMDDFLEAMLSPPPRDSPSSGSFS